jgi:hypothetical protein
MALVQRGTAPRLLPSTDQIDFTHLPHRALDTSGRIWSQAAGQFSLSSRPPPPRRGADGDVQASHVAPNQAGSTVTSIDIVTLSD